MVSAHRRTPRACLAALALALVCGVAVPALVEPARALTLIANDDSYSVIHDHALVRAAPGVLQNDLNLLGGTVLLVGGPTHGSLNLGTNGAFTYVPDAEYVGIDTFSYRVRSLLLVNSNTATVTISVTNAAPVARPDTYATPSRTTLAVPAPGLLGNDTDADGDALSAELSGGGVSGSLNVDANGGFVYAPGGGFSGSATFQYRVWDGVAWSSLATVTINVAAATPAPTPTPTPVPTPTPAPTPTPVQTPTPRPTAAPTPTTAPIVPLPTLSPRPSLLPLPSLPLPLPSLPLLSPQPSNGATASPAPSSTTRGATPSPTTGGAGPTSVATPGGSASSPEPSETASGSGGVPGDGSLGGTGPGGEGDGGSAVPVEIGPGGLGVRTATDSEDGLAGLGVRILGGLDVSQIWFVPAGLLGGPGLLVILWVALQVTAGMAWLPATRRLRGDERHERRIVG